ncbi:Asp23/Gls24 family envelope stress response protein [Pseudonocardia sp. C8]|uniref:Asp23/Gls24 family envelope stress response protein n=1 Tax=Pseudonocardia sp. C8 TaxID=2762759 RepID=UPI0016426D16|nr:Asp23/Gls24 family envelope stress response protein [Pseudonocardia sp. C8]MBC3193302.1 Asp23/Gls24 family envelope stress response protein [Pseudonocardia sp. C8]
MAVEQVEPLACGRDAADVWEHAEAGTLDEHERTCPHCRSARADHDRLGVLVGRLAAEQLRPPPSVLDEVRGAVVADLRPHQLLDIGPDARLGRPAAESALRHVVDTMDGLRALRCRVEQSARTPDGGAPPVWVRMTVTARFGVDLASVTARVRQMIISAGDRTLGVPVSGVDIHVEDLWEDPA